MQDAALDELARDAARALWAGESSTHVLPQLVRIAREAAPGSGAWAFALRQLAGLVAPHDPWRASLVCKAVLAEDPHDEGAWAVMGLSQSLLGHLAYATRCYERALGARRARRAATPEDARLLHNLGHLYDLAGDRQDEAVALLERAAAALPSDVDVAASLAHALARAGRSRDGLARLRAAIRRARAEPTAEHRSLLSHLAREARRARRATGRAPG